MISKKDVQPIFCHPFNNLEGLVQEISAELARCSSFDSKKNTISPEEIMAYSEYALNMRLNILLRTYRGDYHTDSFDIAHLKKRVSSGDELIWFWGSNDQIDRYRKANKHDISINENNQLNLGTVTVLDGSSEFGIGYGELCRSGSMDTELGGKAPILHRTLEFHMNKNILSRKYHTLVLVPRNRKSTNEIRGGEAVNKIHVNYVRSRFWGVAPWYVMQGGNIEMLDFRESNRNTGDVIVALKDSRLWYIANETVRSYVAALCELNIGMTPKFNFPDENVRSDDIHGEIHLPSKSIRKENHGMVVVKEKEQGGKTFLSAIREAEKSGICTSVVRLRLDDPVEAALQVWLENEGYRLMSISPPKKTWIFQGDKKVYIDAHPYGYWSKILSSNNLEKPYYLESTPSGKQEEILLEYIVNI